MSPNFLPWGYSFSFSRNPLPPYSTGKLGTEEPKDRKVRVRVVRNKVGSKKVVEVKQLSVGRSSKSKGKNKKGEP